MSTSLYLISLVVLLCAGILIVWQRNAKAYYRRLFPAEADRNQNEERFRNILEHLPLGMHFYEIGDNNRLIFKAANPAADKILGISHQQFIGKEITEVFPSLIETDIPKEYLRVAQDGGYWHTEHINYQDGIINGAYEVHAFQVTPHKMVALFHDVTEQKRAELEIQAKTEELNRYFSGSLDLLCIANTDGHLLCLNPEWEKTLGYTIDEMVGKSFYDFIHPDDIASTQATIDELKAGHEILNFTNRYRCKDGSYRWLEWRSFPREGFIYAVARDITIRKQTDEILKNERNFLRTVIDLIPGFVCVKDENGKFVTANKALAEAYGTTTSEIVGKSDADFSPTPEEVDRFLRDDLEVIRSRQIKIIPEETVTFADGSIHLMTTFKVPLVGADGECKQLLVVTTDITERKHAESEHEKATALLQAAIQQSPSGILIADAPLVKIRWANPAALEIRGGDSSKLVGIEVSEHSPQWLTFFPDGTPYPSEKLPLSRAILNGEITRGEEVIIRNESGEDRWVSVNAAPVRNRHGEIIAGIVIFHDITDHKKAEAEKEKLYFQLLQSQKMESIGRLAGGVAHDFNNMLQSILGYTDIALNETDPGSPLHDYLKQIHTAADRSANLTRQLLAFARKQTIAPKVLDLNDTISNMLKMLRRLIGEDIDLVWIPKYNLWPVKVDPSQIDQILANLAINARDAIQGVGKVTIETNNIHFDEKYCLDHPEALPGDFVQMVISDDGCGMDHETLSHLFEPFFTTKGVGEGTGLGLATIYGIIKQNNGFINVYSEKNQGTSFHIYLPRYLTESSSIESDQEELPPYNPPLGTEAIILLEDEKTILDLGKVMLERLGYKVLAAQTPSEAIELAKNYVGDIHLLMTDVVMPEMNGRDVADQILKLKPNIKILFMSGYTANVIAHHGILEEGVHFIQKPFTIDLLGRKVRAAID